MIKTFDYRNGEIKITYNESPAVKDYKYDWKRYQIGITTFPVSLNYRLGVELEIRKGGRICYGMLGVQVQPEKEINRVKIVLLLQKETALDIMILVCLMVPGYIKDCRKNIWSLLSGK